MQMKHIVSRNGVVHALQDEQYSAPDMATLCGRLLRGAEIEAPTTCKICLAEVEVLRRRERARRERELGSK